ncbi:cold shock and DUF1294 domain-containing protein [Caldilinea sp.]|uniref:cold shock and DUF1294 domain-containing protein n=1 Tax=Caldilinea sp. TaxID=2293560 RepID=UPI0031372869|nr:cold shock and DUF1294 domain-containing protein [Anaerolineales bacterium]
MKGTVIQFDDKKGFGFIQPDGQAKQVFVHASAVSTADRLAAGQRVVFDVASSSKGPRANNVVVEGAATKQTQPRSALPMSPYRLFGGLAVVATLVLMTIGLFVFSLSWLWVYWLAINLTTLALYLYDKTVAGSGALRVPERILHAAELCGGTPAGLVGQRVLHHKSAKGSYQRTFWIIFVVQIIVIAGLYFLGLA